MVTNSFSLIAYLLTMQSFLKDVYFYKTFHSRVKSYKILIIISNFQMNETIFLPSKRSSSNFNIFLLHVLFYPTKSFKDIMTNFCSFNLFFLLPSVLENFSLSTSLHILLSLLLLFIAHSWQSSTLQGLSNDYLGPQAKL